MHAKAGVAHSPATPHMCDGVEEAFADSVDRGGAACYTSARRSMLLPFTDSRAAWLLLRTKPKREHRVVHVLHHRALDTYCPHLLEPRRHARAPVGSRPLFLSPVFARCDLSSQYSSVNSCPSAFEVVRFGGFLAAVEDEFVGLPKTREGERDYLAVREVRMPPVRGQRAHVLARPFTGCDGLVEGCMPASDRVRRLLRSAGGGRRVEVEARHLECA